MSLVQTLELLSKARGYVERGEQCVLHQREIVDLLEQHGRDPLEAILFLETLEEMQAAYVAHMDSLERKVMTLVKPE
jgi:peptide deformylase